MLTIITDSREKNPYKFKDSIVRKLDTGDYSIQGFEYQVCVERKTKADAYGTIGNGRSRFIRELQRMSELEYSAIVIESSLSSFLEPPPFSQMNPKSAIMSLITWSIRYGVHVYFADNRELGMKLTKSILEKYFMAKNN
jgi:ERCC4-type nuclease